MSNGQKDIAVATIKKCDNSFQVGITQAKIIDGFIDIDNNKHGHDFTVAVRQFHRDDMIELFGDKKISYVNYSSFFQDGLRNGLEYTLDLNLENGEVVPTQVCSYSNNVRKEMYEMFASSGNIHIRRYDQSETEYVTEEYSNHGYLISKCIHHSDPVTKVVECYTTYKFARGRPVSVHVSKDGIEWSLVFTKSGHYITSSNGRGNYQSAVITMNINENKERYFTLHQRDKRPTDVSLAVNTMLGDRDELDDSELSMLGIMLSVNQHIDLFAKVPTEFKDFL